MIYKVQKITSYDLPGSYFKLVARAYDRDLECNEHLYSC